jgi:small-conductance mechanosensitive channel
MTAVRSGESLVFTRRLITLTAWVLGLFALHLWLTFVLVQFPYTRPWGEGLGDFPLGTIAEIAQAIAGAIPGLVTVVIIFLITRFLSRLAHAFFDQFSEGRVAWGWLDEDTAGPTRRIFVAVLWLFALAMAYPYLPGSHTEAFRGLSVLVGLMISLGASNLVGQAASGLILIYSRTLKRVNSSRSAIPAGPSRSSACSRHGSRPAWARKWCCRTASCSQTPPATTLVRPTAKATSSM